VDVASVTTPDDTERRATWLAGASALVLVLRSAGVGAFVGPLRDWQLWLYAVSVGLIAACAVIAGLVALASAFDRRELAGSRLLGVAVGLLAAGIALTAVSGIAGAIDALDSNPTT
jgi:hypothetical protein